MKPPSPSSGSPPGTLDARVIAAELPYIKATIARRGVADRDVDDVASAVLLAAASATFAPPPGDPTKALRRWLAGFCRNLASHHRAKRWTSGVDLVSPEAFAARADPSGGPEAATDVAERLRHALATIERMPPRVRVAFEAYTIGGESMEAIALRVGRPLSSLAKDIARGRAMLDRATARNRGTVGHVLRARRPGAAARRETLRGRLASVRGALATALQSLDLAIDALAAERRARKTRGGRTHEQEVP